MLWLPGESQGAMGSLLTLLSGCGPSGWRGGLRGGLCPPHPLQ